MRSNRDYGKRKRDHDFDDIDDVIERINRIGKIGDLFKSSADEDGIIEPEPNELDDPEILDNGDTLSITLEIPQIRREDIELFMGRTSLSVEVAKDGFRKDVELPLEVVHDGSRATYKNGILDVVLRKA